MYNLIAKIGEGALNLCHETGGLLHLLFMVIKSLFPPRFDPGEFLRNLYKMGVKSVPIIILTAFFTGGIMVIQASVFVKRFGATSLVGWGAGYAVFREVGPILLGLMFSGRVGSNNTAELGTMVVTEQIDGLKALGIDPMQYLIVPRVLSMIIMLFLLTIIGDVIAIVGAALFGILIADVSFAAFWTSFSQNVHVADVVHGLIKAGVFGFIVSLTSCYAGMTVRGGAVGVGRAVNNAVVTAALGIVISDYFLTYSLS
ncbi:ABC transporter permease [Myxococcota bacterium]|nr:ABC transporter permease [Myxococcota bacterium]MBU1381708.1 ABC transporter permease [Myxococcota bacterium]MBU1497484.1 ABC transporter permease [Myxococcota bacterium]